MAELNLPPLPDEPPFDADGALMGFALPWETQPPKSANLPIAPALPSWLTPPPPMGETAEPQPQAFDFFASLGLPNERAVPPASIPMPWETASPVLPPQAFEKPEATTGTQPTEVASPTLSDDALGGHDLLDDLLAVDASDAVAQTAGGWANETDRPHAAQAGPEDQYIVVRLGGTDYGVGLPGIVEIGKRPKTAPLPHVPEWLIGLTNLRGDIISVVDLRTYFGFPAARHNDERLIVLRHENGVTAGLLVDGIRGLRRIPSAADRLPIDGLDTPLTPYVTEMIDYDDRLLPLLDLPRLLTADEFTPAAVPA